MKDAHWIEDVLAQFEARLLLYAQKILNDPEKSRDVVQNTFLKLCRQQRRDIDPHLSAWLYTVCRNEAIDMIRREKTMSSSHTMPPEKIHDDSSDPAVQVDRQEQGSHALGFVEKLPEKQREVLRLKFQGGLSYREISQVTGESTGNVGWLLHTALQTIRGKLLKTATTERTATS